METVISNFEGKYSFLSNFYERPVEWEEITYPSNEHAFQAAKVLNPVQRLEIAAAETPGRAKRMGRRVSLRSDWEEIKDAIMLEIALCKFHQHSDLADKLLATGDATLIEGNWWGDKYWGVCDGEGLNKLGQTLMVVRAQLKLEKQLEEDLQ